jgi:hypothetical protein
MGDLDCAHKEICFMTDNPKETADLVLELRAAADEEDNTVGVQQEFYHSKLLRKAADLLASFAGHAGPFVALTPLRWKDTTGFDGEVIYSEAVGAGYTYVAETADGKSIEQAKQEAEGRYRANVLSTMAQVPISDLVERLRKPSDDEETMRVWDGIRATLLDGVMGTLPRDMFESILGVIDEEREEAADRIEELERLLAAHRIAKV